MATKRPAPANAVRKTSGMPATLAPKPRAMATLAPSAPPPETPRVKGSARGFRKSAWSAAPTIESEAPTSIARRTRGMRNRKKIVRAVSLDWSSLQVIAWYPVESATTTRTARSAKSARSETARRAFGVLHHSDHTKVRPSIRPVRTRASSKAPERTSSRRTSDGGP